VTENDVTVTSVLMPISPLSEEADDAELDGSMLGPPAVL